MFLIRPIVIPGESLSSWRQRAGVANGFRRFPRPDGLSSWVEPDRLPSPKEARWLQDEYRLKTEEIKAMSLDDIGSNIALDFAQTTKLRWVIPCANRKVGNPGGSCCPLCPAEDDIPHFRLAWRFAFVTHCPIHGSPLTERCPSCLNSLWPSNARDIPCNRQHDFRYCQNCGGRFEFYTDDVEPSPSTSHALWECATTQKVPSVLSQAKDPCEVFSGVWAICQLLLRKSAKEVWRCLPDDSRRFDKNELNLNDGLKTFELLPNKARHSVINTAYWLLSDWPHRFVEISRKTKLSRYHFSPSWTHHPSWLNEVIERSLSVKKIGITTHQVHAAIESIQKSGKPISKSAVRRSLGVSDARAIDEILSQRRIGTVEELLKLCRKFEQRLITVDDSRDQKATLIRDYLIFLVSILIGRKIEKVCELTSDFVAALLSTESLNGLGRSPLYKLMSRRANQLKEIYLEQHRPQNLELSNYDCHLFLARSGGLLAGHTVRERIAKLMKLGFSSDLWKSADVFLDVVIK